MPDNVKFKAPVIPNAPTEYNQSLFQRTFNVLRIYFNQLDNHLRGELGNTTVTGDITVSGTITGNVTGNITGNVTGNLTGTVLTAAQPNITSLGTLSALTVDNIAVDGSTIGHTSDTDLLTLASASLTVAGDTTINGTLDVNADLVELTSNDAGAGELPVVSLYRNSSSPANNDEMGSIRFFGNNDRSLSSGGPQKAFYAGIYCEAPKVDDSGAHKGSIRFNVADGSGGSVGITDPTADVAGDEDPSMIITSSLITTKNPVFIDKAAEALQITDSTGSLTSNINPRTTIGNTEQGQSSADARVAIPDAQSNASFGPATLSANFLFGNNIQSDKTTMSQTEVCSMRGSGLFVYNDSDGITVDLPAVSFSTGTTTLRPGDELKFVSFLGTITFDTDASGTQQTIYKIGNTTNGTAALSALTSGDFSLPAGGYMTLRAAWNNIYIIVEHCGVSGI